MLHFKIVHVGTFFQEFSSFSIFSDKRCYILFLVQQKSNLHGGYWERVNRPFFKGTLKHLAFLTCVKGIFRHNLKSFLEIIEEQLNGKGNMETWEHVNM